MNELFSNLFVLIPLAFIIAMRVLQARAERKHMTSRAGAAPKKPSTGVTVGSRERKVLFPLSREVIPESRTVEFVGGTEEEPAPAPWTEEVKPVEMESSPARTAGKGVSFTEKIAKLSPWKQGFIVSEILGPPKGW